MSGLSPYYTLGCSQIVPAYNCNPCPTLEKGRVSSVAFIKPGFSFIDPTNPTEWVAAIEAGNVVMIPNTRGKFDGGTAKKADGYGRALERFSNYEFKLSFNDLNFYPNAAFYDTIDKTTNWGMAFFTKTVLWIVNEAVTFTTKDEVTEDVESDVVWVTECSWQSTHHPMKFTAPAGVQNCFQTA